ncbi:alpha/beta hydrolase [Bacillus subtilis]|uniref:alpha/beta fold hydrolase n=1 Tax=Bacillus subtilis TaxID=1423 RepID=UPI0034512166
MYINIMNGSLYYEVIGKGTPILMIHGFGVDMTVMKGCMEPYFCNSSKSFKRIYIDLPGMGKSKNYDSITTADSILKLLLEFIDAVIDDKAFLLAGESYGGYLSRGILSALPSSVLGMLFICPVVYPEQAKRDLPANTINIKNLELWDRLNTDERKMFTSEFHLFDDSTYKRGLREVFSGNQNADKTLLKQISAHYSFTDWFTEPTFKGPTLFLTGKQDNVVGYKDTFSLMDNYKTSTYAALYGSGHNLQIEKPRVFNTLLSEWLDEVSYK